MKLPRLALALLLIGCAGVADSARAAGVPATRPSDLDPAVVRSIDENLAILADGSDDDKHLAEDRLLNAPPAALPLIEAGQYRPGIDAEARQRLGRIIPRLRGALTLEEAAWRDRQKEAEWAQRHFVESYDRAGPHDPAWDDAARKALPRLASIVPGEKRAGVISLMTFTTRFKCEDPLILLIKAQLIEDLAGREPDPVLQGKDWGITIRLYVAVCEGFDKWPYPEDIKCFAYVHAARAIMKTSAEKDPALRAKAQKWIDASVALVSEVVKVPGMPDGWMTEYPDMITQTAVECGADRGAIVDKIFPALQQAAPDRPGPLVFKGRQYTSWAWDARGSGWANTVTAQGWKLMAQRLALAETALTRAYELGPSDPDAAIGMIGVELGQGKGRDVMEKWFGRAISADPGSLGACRAKLYYLEPKWHGSPQAMLAFGHQCQTTRDYRDGVPYILLDAYVALSKYVDNETAFWHDPAVWKDIESVVKHGVEMYPDNAHDRSIYAYWAWRCGHWSVASAQFKLLGDKLDKSVFDNDTRKIEQARTESAQNAGLP
jgi:hypothetical protein